LPSRPPLAISVGKKEENVEERDREDRERRIEEPKKDERKKMNHKKKITKQARPDSSQLRRRSLSAAATSNLHLQFVAAVSSTDHITAAAVLAMPLPSSRRRAPHAVQICRPRRKERKDAACGGGELVMSPEEDTARK
jgi:hypothetical protein